MISMTLVVLLSLVVVETDPAADEAGYLAARAAAPQDKAGHLSMARLARRLDMDDRHAAHMLAAADLEENPAVAKAVREKLGQRRLNGVWLDAVAVRRLESIEADRRKLATRFADKVVKARNAAAGGDRDAAEKLLAKVKGPNAPWLIGRIFLGAGPLAEDLAVNIIDTRPGFAASQALAELAVESDWPPVRRHALESLKSRDLNDFVPVWMGKLHTPLVVRQESAVANEGGTHTAVYESESWAQRKRLIAETLAVYRNSGTEFLPLRGFAGGLPDGSGLVGLLRRQPDRRTVGGLRMDTTIANARIETGLRKRVFDRDIRRTNDRVYEALEAVAGVELSQPESAWNWWASHQGLSSPPNADGKELVEVSEYEEKVVWVPSRIRFRFGTSCFAAGTLVWTPNGPRAIETLTIGDRVVSQDVETGEVRHAVVLRLTSRVADEHFEVSVGGDSLVASGGHPLWEAGHGWRRVRHIEEGRPVQTQVGPCEVTRLERLPAGDPRSPDRVYNLIVDGTHTYFVGDSRLLVHDDTIPLPTDRTQPGVAVN